MTFKLINKIFLTTISLAVVSLLGIIAWCVGSPANKDWIIERASEKWKDQGFETVDYEGYNWGSGGYFTSYGGAQVWHRLKKIPDNGITYSGYLVRWGDELHVYGPKALDAIRP